MAIRDGARLGLWGIVALCVVVRSSGQGCGTVDLSSKASFATGNLQCKSYSVGAANSNQFYIWALKDNGTQVTSMVVGAPISTGNWAGLGFSSNGQMVGSTALIATLNSTGAVATVYALRAQAPSGVVPATGLLDFVSGGSPLATYDQTSGYVYMSFQVVLSTSTPANPTYLLMAHGQQGSGTSLMEHTSGNRIYVAAEFVTGQVAAGESGVAKLNKKAKIHGSLNILGWGLLLPVGAMIARYARALDPCWFYTHIAFQIVGFACVIAGVATGVDLAKVRLDEQLDAHRGLGIFIFFLAILQVLALGLRPKKDAKVRKYWNWYHHWVGRLALFLAVINIFVGLHMANAERDFKVGYISILSIELAAFVILELLLWLRWNRQRPSPDPASSQDDFHFGGNV